MSISFLMVLSAGGIWLYNEIDNNKVKDNSLGVVADIEKIFDEYIANKDNEEYERVNKIEIEGTTYVGVLIFPTLDNLSLGVIGEYSMSNLKKSVCIYAGNANNKMIIAGHNYRSSFGQLSKINIGDIAYYKTLDGNIYKYKLTEVLELLPTDIEKIKEGKWNMTLFTCTFGGKKRLTLRFELENEMSL